MIESSQSYDRPIEFRGSGNCPSQALNVNGFFNTTVLMAAAESKELAMIKEVVECVQINIPDKKKVSRGLFQPAVYFSL